MNLRKTNWIVTFYFHDYTDENVHFINMPPNTIVVVLGPSFFKKHWVIEDAYRTDRFIPVLYDGKVGYMFDDQRSKPIS